MCPQLALRKRLKVRPAAATRDLRCALQSCLVFLVLLGAVWDVKAASTTSPTSADSVRGPRTGPATPRSVRIAQNVMSSSPDWLDEHFAQNLLERFHYQWHTIETEATGLSLTIHHFPGAESWAAERVQQVLQAIPALEKLTGVAFPLRTPLHIYQLRSEELGVAGLNLNSAGILLTRDEDVLIHELAHYWVGADALPERWMAEGLAELYDHLVRLQLEGRSWKPLKLKSLRRLTQLDAPLALWGAAPAHGVLEQNAEVHEAELSRFFYGKSFLFWYILRVAYGPTFPREVQRWIRSAKGTLGVEDLLTFLPSLGRARIPSPWQIFPGWLVEGSYALEARPQSLAWYLDDDDQDGVFNLEELALKTRPDLSDTDQDGLPDGWELWEGRNPRWRDRLRGAGAITWVPAQNVPTSTHRFVRAGETLRLKAEGLWNTGTGLDAWSGPEGLSDREGAPGRLLGQIGLGTEAGQAFPIGRQTTLTADRDGILYLYTQGGGLQPGRGRLRVTLQGGMPLPELDLARLNQHSRQPEERLSLLRDLREAGFTAIELVGQNVALSLHPTDLETLRDPGAVLTWLDSVVTLYQEFFGFSLPESQHVLLSFDVGRRQALRWSSEAMVFSFGLEELQALPEATRASAMTYPFICALAMPFLQRLEVQRLLEPAAVQALAELLALVIYERAGEPHPGAARMRAWLASYRISLEDPEAVRRDPRVLFAFLYGLYQDHGWGPFLTTLRQWRRKQTWREAQGTGGGEASLAWQAFIIGFSEASNVNLVKRFEDWGLPVTEQTRSRLESVPVR